MFKNLGLICQVNTIVHTDQAMPYLLLIIARHLDWDVG